VSRHQGASASPTVTDVAPYLPIVDREGADAPARFLESLRTTGFAVLANHGIDLDLVRAVHTEWDAFLSSNAKRNYPHTSAQDGYYGPEQSETAKGFQVKDLKEFFAVYPWGQYPAEVSDAALRLYDAGRALAIELLGWIDRELPADVRRGLSMPLDRMLDGSHRTMLRILRYPPLAGEEQDGAVRAAAHEDIDLLTVLPASEEPGLELLGLDGAWHTVPSDTDTIAVNAGDMLQLATRGYIPSTRHRVVNPPGAAARRVRMATPLFLHPSDDVVLSPEHTAKSFLAERIREIRGVALT
jgi:isopenicillin N synthase-like dioxygenase